MPLELFLGWDYKVSECLTFYRICIVINSKVSLFWANTHAQCCDSENEQCCASAEIMEFYIGRA